MSTNKSNGNMFKWIGSTWNPLGGKCQHACAYCSTQKFYYPILKEKYSGPPRAYESFMDDYLGQNQTVFVCAQNDLFCENVPEEVVVRIMNYLKRFPTNKYYFQTKNPGRMTEFTHLFPVNTIVGTTIESNIWYPEMGNAPDPGERAKWMAGIQIEKYLTIEPIMDFDLHNFLEMIQWINPKQVSIGANTFKKVKLHEPTPKSLHDLIHELRKFTSVVIKENLERLL